LKQYPDKPVTEDRESANGITGIKQIKVALIPGLAGSYKLPEIKLRWWNTRTDKEETAVLPEQVLTAVGSGSTSNIARLPEQPVNTVTQSGQQATGSDVQTPLSPTIVEEPFWRWLALAFALAWLSTLVLLFKKPKADKPKDRTNKNSMQRPLKPAISAVERHAAKNDAENTRTALIDWAIAAYGEDHISNLSQISERCSPQLSNAIRQLNQSLYSKEHHTWNGKELLSAFKAEQSLTANNKDHKTSVLKPLYNS
jgi:hypothetical protein